jgi:hypothetical protein
MDGMWRGFVCSRRHPCCLEQWRKAGHLTPHPRCFCRGASETHHLDPTSLSNPKGHSSPVVAHFVSSSFNSIKINHHWSRNLFSCNWILDSPRLRSLDLPWSLCLKKEIILSASKKIGFITTSVLLEVHTLHPVGRCFRVHQPKYNLNHD